MSPIFFHVSPLSSLRYVPPFSCCTTAYTMFESFRKISSPIRPTSPPFSYGSPFTNFFQVAPPSTVL